MVMGDAAQKALALVNQSRNMFLGSIAEDGHPNIKCMFKLENNGLKEIWTGTNTSSRRVGQVRKNPNCCLYFYAPSRYMGLMLTGSMQVLEDHESKARLWREGFERYYKLGIDDPDYCVFHFTAEAANFYHRLQVVTFDL